MTPKIARALKDWFDDAEMRWVNVGSEGKVTARALGTKHPVAVDYILAHCGTAALVLTERGWTVLDSWLLLPMTQARILAPEDPDDDAAAIAGVQKDIDGSKQNKDEEAHAPIPPGAIEWHLCDPVRSKEVVEASASKGDRQKILDALARGAVRWLTPVARADLDAVRRLEGDYPNFAPAIHYIVRHLRLRLLGNQSVYLPPLLLLGPPGIGKTAFAMALARALPMHLRTQSMAEASASWVLTGISRNWTDAAPGIVAQTISECPPGKSPLLMLDELDKAAGERRYPVDTALLSLLEPVTAKCFRDENLDLEMDLRPVSYLLTANRAERIRPEIRSRIKTIEIGAPTPEQMPAIVRSVDAALRDELPQLDEAFAPLDPRTIGCLAAQPPRALKTVLLESYAFVCEREVGRTQGMQLQEADIHRVEEHPTRGSGKVLKLEPRTWSLH